MLNILEDYSVPNHNQETRIHALKILLHFLKYANEMWFKKEEYISVVLNAMEAEKDPRNILLIFNFITQINQAIDPDILYPFTKNFFDLLEAYYPIEFSPPKNSPDKITADDLKNNLNESLASNYNYLVYLVEIIKGKIF